MKFVSYEITSIDEENGHFHVTFTFDNGQHFKLEQVLDYQFMSGYSERELVDVVEKVVDREGVARDVRQQKEVEVLKYRNAFDVTDPVKLDTQLHGWAASYIQGKEVEKQNVQKPSSSVKTLIGVTSLSKSL